FFNTIGRFLMFDTVAVGAQRKLERRPFRAVPGARLRAELRTQPCHPYRIDIRFVIKPALMMSLGRGASE
ncbi:hypothetical protein, partial [Ensifer aridi]|uniref:hypothetical protein n=1 Tax=Ensifer aridi TaxID=1708715 RepID=UPI001AECB659